MKPSHRQLDLPTGTRIHVTGNSCSGKSTLGERLAEALGVPFIELDALRDITLFLIP
jgi:cytidylate kinase